MNKRLPPGQWSICTLAPHAAIAIWALSVCLLSLSTAPCAEQTAFAGDDANALIRSAAISESARSADSRLACYIGANVPCSGGVL